MRGLLLAGFGLPTEVLKVLSPIFMCLMVALSIAVTVLVMMQEGNSSNITGLTGGTSDTFYGKNKGRTKESKLKMWTLILSAALLIDSVLFFLFKISG